LMYEMMLKNEGLSSINRLSIYGHIDIKSINFFEVTRVIFAFLCLLLIDLIMPSA